MWTQVLENQIHVCQVILDDTSDILDTGAVKRSGASASAMPPHPGFGKEIKMIAGEMYDCWESKVDMRKLVFVLEIEPPYLA